MPVRFQLVIDCADPDRLARFWAAAPGYELAPAPAGFATWNDFYRQMGVPEEDLVCPGLPSQARISLDGSRV